MRVGLQVPRPNFPYSIDSYRELFKVYDSSQAILSLDIEPNTSEIPIVIRDLSRNADVWGENGFVTIGEEIIYYDAILREKPDTSEKLAASYTEDNYQVYYLSQSRKKISSFEVVSNLIGAEFVISNPDLRIENNLKPEALGITLPSNFPSGPYSSLGRVKMEDQWYYFATKGAGGTTLDGIESISGSSGHSTNMPGVTSILLSNSGIRFYTQNTVEAIEISYSYSPKVVDPVISDYLNVSSSGNILIKNGIVESQEIHDYKLDPNGLLKIHWTTNPNRSIEVDYERDRVSTLIGCIRGFNTESTPHKAGELVCGFVMAEHHNNLSKAILSIEELIGEDDSEDKDSIDWKLRLLENIALDTNPECPEGHLITEILEEETETSGALVQFTLVGENATGNTLFFGDGKSESNVSVTTHRYQIGAQISPSAAFSNENCQEFSTSNGDSDLNIFMDLDIFASFFVDTPLIPELSIDADFGLTMSGINDFSTNFDLSLESISSSAGSLNYPDIEIGGFEDLGLSALTVLANLSLPSMIGMPDVASIPTIIGFEEITIPTIITFSYSGPTIIRFDDITIPSIISISGIPTEIKLTGLKIPTEIKFTGAEIPDQISISLAISVDTSAISGNCFKLVPCTV